MARIGVFVCHCGVNIAATVDVERVAKEASTIPGVVYSVDYPYMCSDPGQGMIKEAIRAHKLTGVVVAACSPQMHEETFRRAAAEAGLNPYMLEMANVREHCSWVHEDRDEATRKARDQIRMMVERVKRDEPLEEISIPVTRRALVIGGGVAGIQAALDIANGGIEVVLVEREPSIGGHMSQLSETFPTLDCSQCILTPKMVEVKSHRNIFLHSYSEVESVDGYIGNFEVKIRKKPRYVDMDKCNGCGICWNKCPVKNVPSQFDAGLGERRAIYVPFPQAVPLVPVIDAENCIYFKNGKCRACEKLCPTKAIDFEDKGEVVTEKVGAVVVATGFSLYEIGKNREEDNYQGYGEYGYGKYRDMISGLMFERLLSASGPTGGKVQRPSDGTVPKTVVFLECIGSRHPSKGLTYCSKVCCMYTAKHAMLYKHHVHDGSAYVFYMDIRAGGKDYDEFVRRGIEEEGTVYLRGRVSKVYEKNGKLIVLGSDTLSGTSVEIEADMVVLATAIKPSSGFVKLARMLGLSYSKYGFFQEAHPKLKPVETNVAGVFLAGACQGPKDIPESVGLASGAAAKVLGMFAQDVLRKEPVVAKVDETNCAACFNCREVCPYGAVDRAEVKDKDGNLVKVTARVNPGKCTGCGLCEASCPSNVIELAGFNDREVWAEINAA
jgi:heterodisulfide reductase subunit A